MAAYCGITYFDSAAYPAQYRERLVMGNIHGNCLNVDRIERNQSTYQGVGEPDFLSANDVWFMPVVQKVGPDGCLYVLDWYDRYHCYQDASADPEGVDRGHGRLYRVVHEATGRPKSVALDKATPAELVKYLGDANIYLRETAQRLLGEKKCSGVVPQLESIALDCRRQPQASHACHLGTDERSSGISPEFANKLLQQKDDVVRAWGVRATVGSLLGDSEPLAKQVSDLVKDPSRDVQLQVAIAAKKAQARRCA